MRALVVILALAGCGDNVKPVQQDAGIPQPDAQAMVGPCLERPTDLPLPPTGPLPCELLPPGFVAQ